MSINHPLIHILLLILLLNSSLRRKVTKRAFWASTAAVIYYPNNNDYDYLEAMARGDENFDQFDFLDGEVEGESDGVGEGEGEGEKSVEMSLQPYAEDNQGAMELKERNVDYEAKVREDGEVEGSETAGDEDRQPSREEEQTQSENMQKDSEQSKEENEQHIGVDQFEVEDDAPEYKRRDFNEPKQLSELCVGGSNGQSMEQHQETNAQQQDTIDHVTNLIKSMREHAIGIIKDMNDLETDFLGSSGTGDNCGEGNNNNKGNTGNDGNNSNTNCENIDNGNAINTKTGTESACSSDNNFDTTTPSTSSTTMGTADDTCSTTTCSSNNNNGGSYGGSYGSTGGSNGNNISGGSTYGRCGSSGSGGGGSSGSNGSTYGKTHPSGNCNGNVGNNNNQGNANEPTMIINEWSMPQPFNGTPGLKNNQFMIQAQQAVRSWKEQIESCKQMLNAAVEHASQLNGAAGAAGALLIADAQPKGAVMSTTVNQDIVQSSNARSSPKLASSASNGKRSNSMMAASVAATSSPLIGFVRGGPKFVRFSNTNGDTSFNNFNVDAKFNNERKTKALKNSKPLRFSSNYDVLHARGAPNPWGLPI